MGKKKITQVTVKELALALCEAIEDGHGDKYVVLSDDNEGNGYHGCFFHVSPLEEDAADMVHDSQVNDYRKLVIVG